MSVLKPKASPTRVNKVFTVEDANKMLPLVRTIMADIERQYRVVSDLRHRLDHLSSHRIPKTDAYSEEVVQNQSDLDRELVALRVYVDELRALGVEPHPEDALCEFPSVRDGGVILLSWKRDEPEILYWRDPQRDHGARTPLNSEKPLKDDGPAWLA